MTSATLKGAALGSQDNTVSWMLLRRCSCLTEGSGRSAAPVRSMLPRTSTLPRLSWPVMSSRNAGSNVRKSSGNLKVRSKNRLFTDRISKPN